MRLGLSKGKGFKIRYKHCILSLGRSMVVSTSSKVKETRLIARSLGRTLKRTRSMIELMNPQKEGEETPIRKTKQKKVCSVITVKSGVT